MTAIISIMMDAHHTHCDLKDMFMMSKATIIHARMAAIVLICNSTILFYELLSSLESKKNSIFLCQLIKLTLFYSNSIYPIDLVF